MCQCEITVALSITFPPVRATPRAETAVANWQPLRGATLPGMPCDIHQELFELDQSDAQSVACLPPGLGVESGDASWAHHYP